MEHINRAAFGGWSPDPDRIRQIAGIIILTTALILALTLPVSGPLHIGNRDLIFLQWWEEELDPGVLEGILREFEELNPGVTVTLDTRSYARVREMLPRGPGEGTGADILGIDPRWLVEGAIRDRLEPLAFDDHREERLSRPLFSSIITLFYNTGLLEAAGFDRPPKTQTDFERLARAVSDKDRYGLSMALAGGPGIDLYPWFWAAGLRLFPEDGNGRDVAGRGGVAALGYLRDLYTQGLIAPDPFSKTGPEKLEDFRRGRSAMIVAPVSAARELRGLPFDITTVPSPASYVGKPLFGLISRHAALARTSRFKTEGRAFIAFLAERASLLAAAAGAVPGDITAGSYTGNDPLAVKAYSIYEAGEAPEEAGGGEGFAFPGGAAARGNAALDRIITEELRRMFTEGQSPEDTAAAIGRRREEANAQPAGLEN